MLFTVGTLTITGATGLASTDVGRVAQFFDVNDNPYFSTISLFVSDSSVVLLSGDNLPLVDTEIFGLVLVGDGTVIVAPVAYDLRQLTIDDVGRRTATLARVKENNELGTDPDDNPVIYSFFDAAVLRVSTMANLITSLTASVDWTLDIPLSIIPRRLWTALTYFVMKEWFKSIGEIELSTFYDGEYNKEASTYRFNPDKATYATRPYRPF